MRLASFPLQGTAFTAVRGQARGDGAQHVAALPVSLPWRPGILPTANLHVIMAAHKPPGSSVMRCDFKTFLRVRGSKGPLASHTVSAFSLVPEGKPNGQQEQRHQPCALVC